MIRTVRRLLSCPAASGRGVIRVGWPQMRCSLFIDRFLDFACRSAGTIFVRDIDTPLARPMRHTRIVWREPPSACLRSYPTSALIQINPHAPIGIGIATRLAVIVSFGMFRRKLEY